MKKKNLKRRDFIKGLMRMIIVAFLAGIGVHLSVKKRDPHECFNQGICRGCGEFKGCILPQAQSAKKTETKIISLGKKSD